jgi:hypothetical protein
MGGLPCFELTRPGRLEFFSEHRLVGAGALPADQAYKRNDERRDRNDDDGEFKPSVCDRLT